MYNKYYVSLGLQNEIEFESILFIKRKETIKKKRFDFIHRTIFILWL